MNSICMNDSYDSVEGCVWKKCSKPPIQIPPRARTTSKKRSNPTPSTSTTPDSPTRATPSPPATAMSSAPAASSVSAPLKSCLRRPGIRGNGAKKVTWSGQDTVYTIPAEGKGRNYGQWKASRPRRIRSARRTRQRVRRFGACDVFRSASAQPSAPEPLSTSVVSSDSSPTNPAPPPQTVPDSELVAHTSTPDESSQKIAEDIPIASEHDTLPPKRARLDREKRQFREPETAPANVWCLLGGCSEDEAAAVPDLMKWIGYEATTVLPEQVKKLDPFVSVTPAARYPIFKIHDRKLNEEFTKWINSTHGIRALVEANVKTFGAEKTSWKFVASSDDQVTLCYLQFATLCWSLLPEDQQPTLPWTSFSHGAEIEDAAKMCGKANKEQFLQVLKEFSKTSGKYIKHISKAHGTNHYPWK